jgi:myosin heavy subunit
MKDATIYLFNLWKRELLIISKTCVDYIFCSQGKVKVDSMDDSEELEFTDLAFDTLGFSEEEKQNAFKLTSWRNDFQAERARRVL